MAGLDRILTRSFLIYAAAISGWQVAAGAVVLGMAAAYFTFLGNDPVEQEHNLDERAQQIEAAFGEKFCENGTADEQTLDDLREWLRDDYDATAVREHDVSGLPNGTDAKNTDKRQDPCTGWPWKSSAGSIALTSAKDTTYTFNSKGRARTKWASVNLGSKRDEHSGDYVVFFEERPLEGGPARIAYGIGIGLIVAVLSFSVFMNNYLHSRLGRLAEFGRRMSFVLHDLRHNLERIRTTAAASRPIDHLTHDSERLIEDGRLVANIHQEPADHVDLHGLLTAATEGFDVEMDCPDGLIVRVPPRNFGSAITNLLYNAEEHGSSKEGGGHIELGVSVRKGGGWPRRTHDAVITIADSGPGTDSPIERSGSIRQAIDRLERTRDTNRRRGLGLLSILYTVQECGGRFALLNREDGQRGLLAEIVIPVRLRRPAR